MQPPVYSYESKHQEHAAMIPSPQVYTPSPYVYAIQPGVVQPCVWIPIPPPIPGVPPGLEYLTMVDTIVVQQIVEMIEVLTGYETENKYSLRNAIGQQVYFAAEHSSFGMRYCCGKSRQFSMHIVDNFRREVMRIRRPFKCCGNCCCSCTEGCAEECTIESPPGQPIGRVVQMFSCCSYDFSVRDPSNSEMFRIEGPNCCMGCSCGDKRFTIYSGNRGVEIGCINKKWGGVLKESYTDADTFVVNFPIDLDVRLKALLLGATFLIDFMAFEDSKDNN